MNIIIANEQQGQIATLDIDIIKNITGSFDASEIVEMFKNFFYEKMILDVTAIRGYTDVKMFKIIAEGLESDKTIFFIPEGNSICTPNFLAQLVILGIYNFTTNIEGVKYLLKKSNTYDDVAHIQQMGGVIVDSPKIQHNTSIQEETGAVQVQIKAQEPVTTVQAQHGTINRTIKLGVKNVTDHTGASSLIYMMKKELVPVFGKDKVVAIEVNKNDFQFYNDNEMLSVSSNDLKTIINRYNDVSVILIDLNDFEDNIICDDILYLIEASTLKLNKLVRKNKNIFTKIKDKKIILNQSLLSPKDISELEYEAGIKFYYTLPPLNDRKNNTVITELLAKIGLVQTSGNSNKIFGLFKR